MSTKQSFKVCCCFSRIFKQNVVEAPTEIKNQFHHYSTNGIMSFDEFRRFLIEYQCHEEVDVEIIIEKLQVQLTKEFNKHLNIFHHDRKGLNLEAFFRYLFSDANPPLLPTIHHDMKAPLSHYFIYTGHNSYLTGNQLSSDCSDVPIIKALQRGVRVIELDLWPNSAKDGVDILHGWTLTSPVELITCLKSIKEHAFCASAYPVIITLEDHLTPDLQTKVAKMITQTFGDLLFIPGQENKSHEFLSPDSLKNKILISTKPPKENQDPKRIEEMQNAQKVKTGAWGEEVPDIKAYDKNEKDMVEDHQDDEDIVDDEGDDKFQQNSVPEYKSLIAIDGAKREGGLDEVLKVNPNKVRRISLNELKLKKVAETHKSHIVRFTEKNFLRVYPKTSRIDSSNYNPLIGWMHGAQMVALNMQGHGRSLWLMQGMFRANGGCGYVKKPDFLLKVPDPPSEILHFRENLPVKKTLTVRLFMGEGWYTDFHHTHFDMCSPPDFYTRIGIAGVRDDSVMKKTKTIADEWSPVWDEEFMFPLAVPELALLQIEVHESDPTGNDDFGGQTYLPVCELKTGIRSVSLYNRKGEKFKSVKLLMRFEFAMGETNNV